MTDISIKLQSTVDGFTQEFMHKLPLVEADMRAHGLEPSEFIISKDRGAAQAFPLPSPFFYEYTVFVGEERFTVTEPNDMRFLEFFHNRCITGSEDEKSQRSTSTPNLFRRFLRWISQPV